MKLRYNDTVQEVRAVFDHDGHTYAVAVGADRALSIVDLTFMEFIFGAAIEFEDDPSLR